MSRGEIAASPPRAADPGRRGRFQASWFDLAFVVALVGAGLVYLRDPHRWASWIYVGNDQWGDADFWWQGALQLARGVFWDNPAITFRMGYALFAGASVAVLGPHYEAVHLVLTLAFLGLAVAAYLALRGPVGRPVAVAMALVVAFTPAHAVWLAVSTSDGLGLGLNIASVVSLVVATRRRGGSLPFVALAGLFLSFAGLTRPLMTLFILPSALVVLLATEGRLLRRATAVAVLLGAFATPTLGWVEVLHAKTGVFALAGYDSSIFYAASTSKYQAWTPEMYPAVQEAAQKRLGAPPTPKQLNDEFWIEAKRNYFREWRYHLRRLGPNIMRFADFDAALPGRPHAVAPWIRGAIRGGLGLVLFALALLARRWIAAALVACVAGLSLWPPAVAWVVVASAAGLLFAPRGPAARPVAKIVPLYWLTGVAAVFMIGGISRYMPADPSKVNSLGDRLGTQCFFADDWLVLLALGCLAGPAAFPSRLSSRFAGLAVLLRPRALPRAALAGGGALAALALCAFLTTGIAVAGWRGYRLAAAGHTPYPPAAPVIDGLCRAAGYGPSAVAQPDASSALPLRVMWGEVDPAGRPAETRVFTGAIGALLWRMGDQGRTRALFDAQTDVAPFAFGLRADVEFDAPLAEDAWRARQGLYVIRSFAEEASHKGLWRESLPEVQAFVPLAADGRSYDAGALQRFPLARYASMLTRQMSVTGGTLEWWAYPTADLRRWFVVQPPADAPASRDVGIGLDLAGTVGRRSLSFAFRVEPAPGHVPPSPSAAVRVSAVGPDGQVTALLARDVASRGEPTATPAEAVAVDLPEDASHVDVTFPGVTDGEYVRVMEYKLTSEDVEPTMTARLCGPARSAGR